MNHLMKGILVIATLMFSTMAMAHPGHGTFTGHEISHYLTSPLHIGSAAVVVLLIIALISRRFFKKA